MSIRVPKPKPPLKQGSSNGSGDNRSPKQEEPPQPRKPSVQLRFIVGGVLVLSILLGIGLLINSGRSQAAPDAVQVPAVQATAAPTPVSTPIPTATAGETAIAMVEQLISEKEDKAAVRMAENALQTAEPALLPHERTRLQELVLSAKLNVLFAQPLSVLQVAEQQQVIHHYRFLEQQAADVGIPFPLSDVAGAKRAKAAGKLQLSLTLAEEAYTEGQYTKADQEMVTLTREVFYTLGWNYAEHGSDSRKATGVRMLSASYELEKEQGITHGAAWAELKKYCNPDANPDAAPCPDPIETPLLATINGGRQ